MTKRWMRRLLLLLPLSAVLTSVAVADSATSPLRHAQRIVTLSPHLADLVYSAGVEDKLVGVVRYTTPALQQGRRIVGDAFSVDVEAILRLRPDAVLVWQEGTPKNTIVQLRELGLNVHPIQTKTLEDIPAAINQLSGSPRLSLAGLSTQIKQLSQPATPKKVFIQFGNYPSYTLNGKHILSEGLARCGINNVFSSLAPIAPQVDVEMVVRQQPDIILAITGETSEVEQFWRAYLPGTTIVYGDPDSLSQPDVQMLNAITQICAR